MSRNIPITAVDQYDFLEHRRQQEKNHWGRQDMAELNELSSILTVEVNTTELCNRACHFVLEQTPKYSETETYT
jgi:hypothetical protein